MDLFHVQRFYGNTDEVENVENDHLEKERLESLKDKIKRKRQALQDGAPKKKKVNKEGKAVENAKKISNGVEISEVKAEKDTEMQIDDVIEHRRKEKGVTLFAGKVSKKARTEATEGAGLHREKSSNEERENGSKRRKKVREVRGEKKAGLTSLAKETEREEEVDTRTEHANEGSNDTRKTIGNTKDFDKSYENSDTDGNEKLQNTDLSFQNTEAAKTSQIEMEESENTHSYFKVLGSFDNKKEKKLVKRLLPKWIAEAKHIDSEMYSKKLSINDANFLEDFSKSNLKEQNIEYLFPVQSCVIPIILSQNSKHCVYHKVGLLPPDICVSAPTGSGKTLAYTLPIVQILAKCEWRRLQAIVILPSRDLAQQVKNVIAVYTKGSHVKVGLASGIKSLHDEQQQLVSKGNCGFISNIDILVCTPGRLVEHIASTDGFSLEYLRFLIIDEADCLLSQSYHHWLEKIYDAVDNSNTRNSSHIRGILPVYPASAHATPSIVNKIQLPLQKLLFSATMTHNPEKLEPLKLYKPVLFTSAVKESNEMPQGYSDVQEKMRNQRYMLPESLEQKFTVCRHSEKPLVVIYLVKVMEYKRVLCFTGSIESTHRLALLVGKCGIRTAEFSSTLNQTQRKGILRDFRSGKIDLLICSDSMARGMDIENVDFVVSYDPAVNMKTYVHRVGRTARAGNRGIALTLLAPKEVYHFKKMLKDHGNSSGAHKLSISSKELEPLVDEYEIALISLKDSVKYEIK